MKRIRMPAMSATTGATAMPMNMEASSRLDTAALLRLMQIKRPGAGLPSMGAHAKRSVVQLPGGPAVLGHGRGLGRGRDAGRRAHRCRADLAGPEPGPTLALVWPAAAPAHQRGDLRLRRLRALRDLLLRRAAHLP